MTLQKESAPRGDDTEELFRGSQVSVSLSDRQHSDVTHCHVTDNAMLLIRGNQLGVRSPRQSVKMKQLYV